jgi:sulfatase maturation enzyme AslB (radical SAM superfamily)
MYDYIRGVKDGFQYVKKTYQSLKTMKYTNLTVGIGTVVSKFNVQYLAQIYEYVMHTLKPDSYVTEIAEQRHELDTLDADISPEVDEYHQVVDYLCTQLIQEKFHGISRLIRAFRLEYYQMTAKMLRIQRQIIPCYGGFNSCLITPDGNVWPCCVRENSMGSLKDTGYDFRKLWSGKQAEDVRKAIKTDRCFCPLANVAYTNMLCYPLSWWRICMNIFKTF